MNSKDLWQTPVTLTGHIVRLEPLTETQIPGLEDVGKDKRI